MKVYRGMKNNHLEECIYLRGVRNMNEMCINDQASNDIDELLASFYKLINDEEYLDRHLLMSHLCAYQLASKFAKGGRFLEIGCGGGYGAYYLSHVASDVSAIDFDKAVIARAQQRFVRPNLHYIEQNGVNLAFNDGQLDCVGTFQVIEHIPEPDLVKFVSGLSRVLSAKGICVISTLNLEHNRKNANYQKAGFHEKEFTAPELLALLQKVFPDVTLYGLYPKWRLRAYRRMKRWGMHRWSAKNNPVQRFFDFELSTKDYELRRTCTPRAIDLIAVCRKAGKS